MDDEKEAFLTCPQTINYEPNIKMALKSVLGWVPKEPHPNY
jgi:hypothetical protein